MHFGWTHAAGVALCAVVGASSADAQSLSEAAFPYSGWYFGGHLGAGLGTAPWSATADNGLPAHGTTIVAREFDAFKGTGSYFTGLQVGRDWELRSKSVAGIVADVSIPNEMAGSKVAPFEAGNTAAFHDKVTSFGSLRARYGIMWDNWLLYGTGGLAWATTRTMREQVVGTSGGVVAGDREDTSSRLRIGWAAGFGAEVPVDARWSANAEYLWAGFGRQDVKYPASGDRYESDLSLHSIRFGLNYHYDAASSEKRVPAARKSLLEDWAVHGQTTLTYQYAAPFRAPYQGPNSLHGNQARETWDVTFYLGKRLWQGAELWINPEIDQGFGLNGTLGVAAFPSAEAYKVGAAEPYARLPRLFLRQTIGLGSEMEDVEAGPNQLGGRQAKDRIVVTVGKFASTDVFDVNKYGHDPRVDFLNWGFVDTASFDYAADAWAFTYGAAVEWYRGPWTLRAGIFDLPIVPNSSDLDPTFKQHQWMGEIERRYSLSGQPGKFALTGFLTLGRMGRFDDAVNAAAQTSGVPELSAVRRFQGRTGVSVNLEQQLMDGVGLFARAGLSDGRTEQFAFTDSDQTIAAGLVVTGGRWGRPNDTWGVAGLINNISPTHRAYLAAGGLTALVGDGKLPRAAPENVFETYYSLPFFNVRLTGDYQFIVNPAFNQDRGPVSVFALRLRSSF